MTRAPTRKAAASATKASPSRSKAATTARSPSRATKPAPSAPGIEGQAGESTPSPAPQREKRAKPVQGTPTAGAVLRTRDLVARVAEASGAKAKDARLIVEATLAALGAAIDAGESLRLPPLGKLTVVAPKSPDKTGPLKLKLHRATLAKGAKDNDKEPLADPDEDS